MAKHVFIFIPAFGNTLTTTTFLSVLQLQQVLASKAINTSVSALSFPDIAELRSMAATIWYDTMPQCEYLLFIDSDMGFQPDLVLDMILFDHPIVGSIYPQRRYPVSWAGSGNGGPTAERRGNFMKVEGVGMGCCLIRRDVMTTLMERMPKLIDNRISLHPAAGILQSVGANRLIRAFEKLDLPERGIVSEDLSFCIRWNQCGGETWAAINYHISHVGMHDFGNNYMTFITQQQSQQEQQAAIMANIQAGAAPQLMGFDPSGKPILTMPAQPQQTVQVMPQEAPVAQAAE